MITIDENDISSVNEEEDIQEKIELLRLAAANNDIPEDLKNFVESLENSNDDADQEYVPDDGDEEDDDDENDEILDSSDDNDSFDSIIDDEDSSSVDDLNDLF